MNNIITYLEAKKLVEDYDGITVIHGTYKEPIDNRYENGFEYKWEIICEDDKILRKLDIPNKSMDDFSYTNSIGKKGTFQIIIQYFDNRYIKHITNDSIEFRFRNDVEAPSLFVAHIYKDKSTKFFEYRIQKDYRGMNYCEIHKLPNDESKYNAASKIEKIRRLEL